MLHGGERDAVGERERERERQMVVLLCSLCIVISEIYRIPVERTYNIMYVVISSIFVT